MYNDNTFDNLFTGYESGGDYIFPTASQNLVITFDPTPDDVPFHLSALEGDFTTDPVTITSETGESEDITIGNAPAKVLTATMLNPSNTMGSLVWGDGKVYIGCETATATADVYNSYPVHVLVGSVHYGIDSSGRPRRNSTTLGTLGGTGVAVISNSDGSDVLFISTTSIGRRVGGSYTQLTTPSASQSYLAEKFRAMPYTVGVLLDANGCPTVYNSVEKNTKQTLGYVPMGVFDFSNVDAFGITFGVEAYDKMTLFDADATAWWNAIDFDNGGSGRRLDWLADELCQHYGFSSPTVSNDAVNGSVVRTANPITSYAVTGRDILKWLSEAMGCSARIGRTGGVELWTFPLEILSPPTPITPVATITPDTIISNTRVKGKAEIPKLNQVQCYNVLGAGYEYHTGTPGTYYPLYIVANPFIDPSGGGSELSNIYGVVSRIPAFYPTTISVACGDPRWDAGDFVCITTTDGSPQFNIPIMHETLSWNGTCIATLSATGKQVRDIPEGMNNTDLSSMVDSNPSAVVNKIEAHGITADCITSGTIDADLIRAGTIQDANGYNSWDLDSGDLTITTGSITTTYTKTYAYADYSASDITRIQQIRTGQITPTDADYEKYDIIGIGVINAATQNRVQQIIDTQTDLVKTVSTVIDPSQSVTTMTISVDVPAVGTAQAFNYSSEYSGVMVSAYTMNASRFKGGAFEAGTIDHAMGLDFEELYMSDSPEYLSLKASGISFDDGADTTTMNKAGISVTDGTNVLGIACTGITFQDGIATPTLRVLRRTSNSADTKTVTLENGVYLAITTHQNNATASQSGLAIIQVNNTSSILEIASANNSTLSISGHTLTWTTTNTYRQLRLIYLS